MEKAIKTIRERYSCRSYSEQPIEIEKRVDFESYLLKKWVGPFGNESRFKLIDLQEIGRAKARKLGTYGTIRGAGFYIIGAVKTGPKAMVDFGYSMEQVILYATSLGLGTCWLGGIFKRAAFARHFELRKDEIFVAASPVGYPAKKKSLIDVLVRRGARSKERKPWSELFYIGSFESLLCNEKAADYIPILEAVRWSPSASNRQPWRLVKAVDDNTFHFYLNENKLYNKVIRGISLQHIDMGIAMSHFELASKELNRKGAWHDQAPLINSGNMQYIASFIPAL